MKLAFLLCTIEQKTRRYETVAGSDMFCMQNIIISHDAFNILKMKVNV